METLRERLLMGFGETNETSNLSSGSVEEGLKTSESLKKKTSTVESVNFADSDLEGETGADLRVIPSDNTKAETCIYCKNSGTTNVLFARGY